MRLNDKIQFKLDGKTITCTATFCYIKSRKKPGIFWVDEDFSYWNKKKIPENYRIVRKGNQSNPLLLYRPDAVSPEDKDWLERMEANWKKLRGIDQQQKEIGNILYRYVDFPYADGKSVYQVTKVTQTCIPVYWKPLCVGWYRPSEWGRLFRLCPDHLPYLWH